MLKPGPAKKLIVTVNESDRWHGQSVYNALLQLFQRKGLSGATVSRAIAGFTGRGTIRTINIVDISADLPIRVEVVDSADAIDRVLPDVYDIVERGLVEVQETQVAKVAGGSDRPSPAEREGLMRSTGNEQMLSVHIGAGDKWEGEPLHEAIVKRARQLEIVGATVYRGVLGYGAGGRLHRHKTFALSQDEPVLVVVVDTEERVEKLLAALDGMASEGSVIAVSDVTVVRYARRAAEVAGPPAVLDVKQAWR